MIIPLLPSGLTHFRDHLSSCIFHFRAEEKREYLFNLIDDILKEELPKVPTISELRNLLSQFFREGYRKKYISRILYFLLSDLVTYKILGIDALVNYTINSVDVGIRNAHFKNLVVIDSSLKPRKSHYGGEEKNVFNLSVFSLEDDGIYSIPVWDETLPEFAPNSLIELNEAQVIPYIGEIYKWRSEWPPPTIGSKNLFSIEGLQFTTLDFDSIFRSLNLNKFVPDPRSPRGLLTTYGIINGKIIEERSLLPQSSLMELKVKDWTNKEMIFDVDVDRYSQICKNFKIEELEGNFVQVLVKQELTYRYIPRSILIDINITDEDTCFKNFMVGYFQHRKKINDGELYEEIKGGKDKIKKHENILYKSDIIHGINNNIVFIPSPLRKFPKENWSLVISGKPWVLGDSVGSPLIFTHWQFGEFYSRIIRRNPLVDQLYKTESLKKVYVKIKDFSKILEISKELLKTVNYLKYCEKNNTEVDCVRCKELSGSKGCPFEEYLGFDITKYKEKLSRILTRGGDIQKAKQLVLYIKAPCQSEEAIELSKVTEEITETILI